MVFVPFTCVDDFGTKYCSKDDADHLLNALKESFNITVNWSGKYYYRFEIDWNYTAGHVTISMSKYVPALLQKLNHIPPSKLQHASYSWLQIHYGKKVQYAKQ